MGVPTPRPATLAALESFNLANGTIGPEVTLGGTASINKRTDGSVTIGETPDVGGGVFDEQGSLTGATTTTLTTLYWEPTSGDTWDTGNTANWSLTPGGASNQMWATGDVAVFDTRYANGVTNVVISGAVSAAGIKINDDGFNIEDPGGFAFGCWQRNPRHYRCTERRWDDFVSNHRERQPHDGGRRDTNVGRAGRLRQLQHLHGWDVRSTQGPSNSLARMP